MGDRARSYSMQNLSKISISPSNPNLDHKGGAVSFRQFMQMKTKTLRKWHTALAVVVVVSVEKCGNHWAHLIDMPHRIERRGLLLLLELELEVKFALLCHFLISFSFGRDEYQSLSSH